MASQLAVPLLGRSLFYKLPRCPVAALVPRRRSATSSPTDGDRSTSGSQMRWDITDEHRVKVIYLKEDFDRFTKERALFRAEPRLKPESLPKIETTEMDWAGTLTCLVSVLRITPVFTRPFQELCDDRTHPDNAHLMTRFGIPPVEWRSIVKPLHNKAVPGEGTYIKIRMQVYWLAMHVWLFHTKQHQLQATEGLWGSAICALLTRRLFENLNGTIRYWVQGHDVPAFSVTAEIEDLFEFLFGFCAALDDVWKEEAPSGTAAALALQDAELPAGCHGLAPRVKYALWANIFSGAIPHDAPHLHELTVYLLRQRLVLEDMSRDTFFMHKFKWVDLPEPGLR